MKRNLFIRRFNRHGCSIERLEARAMLSDYFVSPTGSDLAAGNSASPWRTLQKAADTVAAGDSVTVRAGTYAGFYLDNSGTPSAPIRFTAEPGAQITSRNATTADGINLEAASYVTIEGFTVDNTSGTITRAGVRLVLNTHVTIRNNYINGRQVHKWGILTGFTPNALIEGNTTINAGGEHGIYVSNSTAANDNIIVRGNISYGNAVNGIQFNGDLYAGGDGVLSGNIIENNIVHDNGAKGLSLISMSNSIVRNNVIYNNRTGPAGAAGIHLVDEPGANRPSNNNVVVNNTIVEPRMAAIRITNGSGNVLFNNLMVNPTSRFIVDEAGGNSFDSTSNLGRTAATGLFVGGADYHLATGSIAIDAGTSSFAGQNAPTIDFEGTSRPRGSGHDVGADEFVNDTTAPTIVTAEFLFESAPNLLRIVFSEDVAASLAVGDLRLEHSGGMVLASALNYNAQTYIATFTLPALTDGNYSATFLEGSVTDASGNPLGGGFQYNFFVLIGDATRDRAVDVRDLMILATHWLGTGKTYTQADFNYDGIVNQPDLTILAQNWQTTLPAPAASAESFATSHRFRMPRRPPVRIELEL